MLKLPYRSKFEIRIAADLGKKKIEFDYEPKTFTYVPKIRSYTPDFYIKEKNFQKYQDLVKKIGIRG